MERLDGCLDADEVVAFLSGGLASLDLVAFEGHVARCEACRKLLSLVARSDSVSSSLSTASLMSVGSAPGSPGAGNNGADPIAGTRIGRYVLREQLGVGAMGVVFAARDPELDRNVAVKLLRSDLVAESSRTPLDARLLREARAMAQLAHPNVVAVYDVGAFGDRVFIAMELVEGQTLAQWLADKRRPLREVVAMFIAAGRGLAAAHAAGLVHRDFKPENVLLGIDGRVRVTDFGLAYRAAMPVDPVAVSTGAVERDRTTTGVLAGTPFYMAPEQLTCERVDAGSDQFSFCVALHAALTGTHPFPRGGRTEGALAARPRRDAMPSWLWRALRPGLSVARERRYPSMDALLSRLAIGSRRRGKIGFGVAVVAVALTIVAGIVRSRGEPGDRVPTCQGAERLLTGVWDQPRARAVEQAFRASGGADAATRFASASLLLDQYARRWIAMRTHVCERALSGEGSEALSSLRTGCLDARLAELRELTDQLADADAALVGRALIEMQRLGKLDVCANDAALQHMMEFDVTTRPAALLALDAAGRLSYFVTDSEGTLWQIPMGSDGTVRERTLVIDSVVGYPSIVIDADQRWQLFVRRVERNLWRGSQDALDGRWHGETVTEEVTDDPGVALVEDKLVYFVRKTDGWLWRYWQDSRSGSTWTGLRVADVVTGRPGVGFDLAGDLYAFVRKADGSLWYARHARPAGPPERPLKLSDDVATDPTFALEPPGRMTYFARWAKGSVMTVYQDAVGSRAWHRFEITENVAGSPAITFDHEGREICMMRKVDGSLWHGIQQAPGGGTWHETIVARGLSGDPAITQDPDNRTIYVVRKADGSLWQGRQDAPGGTTWHEDALIWIAGGRVNLPDRAPSRRDGG